MRRTMVNTMADTGKEDGILLQSTYPDYFTDLAQIPSREFEPVPYEAISNPNATTNMSSRHSRQGGLEAVYEGGVLVAPQSGEAIDELEISREGYVFIVADKYKEQSVEVTNVFVRPSWEQKGKERARALGPCGPAPDTQVRCVLSRFA